MRCCEEQYEMFENVLNMMIEEFLPIKIVKQNTNDHPWITDDFHRLINLRQFYFHNGNKIMFNFYRNKVNRTRKSLQKKFYDNKMDNIKSQRPGTWWNDIKDIIGTKKKSNNLTGLANTVCDGDMQQLASKINSAFQAVSDDMRPLMPEDYHRDRQSIQDPIPDRYIISTADVTLSLSRINTRKAIGPDAIPNWVLKSCALCLAPPVCAIWNSCFRESYTPSVWKSGDVCPLAKVNPPMKVEKDLRPITLSPQLSKCLEWYPREWLLELLKDVMDPHQFGSMKGSSTTLALVELIHGWVSAVETLGSVVRVLFLDFRKAFDRVDHHILLSKLVNHDVPDFIISWLASFLSSRKQRVKIDNIKSDWCHIKAGVPQGTLLGPIAFLIHINDLKTGVHDMKYVDDTSLWEVCDRTGYNSKLQEAADQASKWTDENNMALNVDKTKYMSIYFGRKPLTLDPITINGSVPEEVNVFKLLGLLVNSKITWEDHVDYICSKASQRVYFLILLKRAGKPAKDIIDTYVSIIRSVLEYVCVVWHPGLTQEQSNKIEHIQNRCLDIAHPELDCEKTLEKYGLDTLKDRREKMCKDLFDNVKNENHKLHYLLPPVRDYISVREYRKYEPPKLRTYRLKKSPINYCLFNCQ